LYRNLFYRIYFFRTAFTDLEPVLN